MDRYGGSGPGTQIALSLSQVYQLWRLSAYTESALWTYVGEFLLEARPNREFDSLDLLPAIALLRDHCFHVKPSLLSWLPGC